MNRRSFNHLLLETMLLIIAILTAARPCRADGPADNVPGKVRPIPPAGIEVSKSDREELEQGLSALGGSLKQLASRKDERVQRLLPDVQIFQKAVHDALAYHEF